MSDQFVVHIRDFEPGDIGSIALWPPYPPDFQALNYAVRENGWLAEFSVRPETRCFVHERHGDIIAFTILAKTADDEAEFRIALRGDVTGKGLGETVASLTFEKGFVGMGLNRIHLIVRKNNPRATRLYRRLGFVEQGEMVKSVNGRVTEFLVMDLRRPSAP